MGGGAVAPWHVGRGGESIPIAYGAVVAGAGGTDRVSVAFEIAGPWFDALNNS